MGCGGPPTTARPGSDYGDTPSFIVHGDIFLPDTRSVLAILSIGEVKYVHKEITKNTLDNIDVQMGANADGESLANVASLSDYSPMLEDSSGGKKHLGSSHEIMMHCCLRD